ncbi:dystrophin-like [Colias croceus]|uniref:dystrophin-like n=1 Tax=Colias crocea TaxID=72248 RepID=UPI001E27A812|nr:dystrophin-like [Colias croceus]
MALINWRKTENEAGYPCYIDEESGKQDFNHPNFNAIEKLLEEHDGIKYSAYKIAFKIFVLQKQLKVPPLRISSGVFARHQLSLSESSLSLDIPELEAVLADIYFAAEKEGLFVGDVDLTVDLVINLTLNVYDEHRNTQIRVLAAKTLLILLSEESVNDKWLALANCCADHNGCVSPRRLSALLSHVVALTKYLGCSGDQVQSDVDSCFNKSAGMLGVSARAVADWGVNNCSSTRWLSVAHRVVASRNCATANASCVLCVQPLIQVLKFKCAKCTDVYFCEKCYLYDRDLSHVAGHKKTHLVFEVNDGEIKPSECMSFMKGMRRFFFCTKTGKKKASKKCSKKRNDKVARAASVKRKKEEKPAIFTSTVGKASGNKANNPATTLQDIITQLENQTQALQDISDKLQNVAKDCDDELKLKVDAHYCQITAQISRLKELKENLTADTNTDKTERPQAFDLFSPIPVDEKQAKLTENIKNQPRILSMDSGNFSVTSKHESQNLLTMSGDALKPIVVHATSDSISAVSMSDMSNWYNETTGDRRPPRIDRTNQSISATEQRFAADIRSVETSNDKMKELNADLDTVLDRLQQILTHNFTVDESCFDNSQLRETANEMEGLLGTLIRGVEQRATLNASKGMV